MHTKCDERMDGRKDRGKTICPPTIVTGGIIKSNKEEKQVKYSRNIELTAKTVKPIQRKYQPFFSKKCLKAPKGQSEAVNQRRTDNTWD